MNEERAFNSTETLASGAPIITWDIDAVWQSAVYSELEVQDIDWHTDENTPGDVGDDPPQPPSKRQCRESSQTPGVNSNSSLKLQKKETNESGFNFLSDELVLRIFSFLKRKSLANCLQVCKHWNRLGCDKNFWKSVDMSRSVVSADGVLESILHRGVENLLLRLTNVNGFVCSKKCPGERRYKRHSRNRKGKSTSCCDNISLKSLDATLCKFEIDHLSSLLKKCKSLKVLSLEGCVVSDADLRAISQNADLEELNLLMCTGVTSSGIEMLSQGCQRLKSLNLGWVKLTEEDLLKISNGFSLLEELNISGMKEAMTDQVVISVMKSCKNLVNLDLSDSPSIGASSIEAIIKHEKLNKLSLSRCYNIPASVLSRVAVMKNLEHLQLFGFLNKTVTADIKKICPQLCINSEMFSTIARPNVKDLKKT